MNKNALSTLCQMLNNPIPVPVPVPVPAQSHTPNERERDWSSQIDNLISLSVNRYISSGTHVVCFANDPAGLVVKCCYKSPETILDKFTEFVEKMKLAHFPILPPITIIDDPTQKWLIYTQQMCSPLSELQITPVTAWQVLDFVANMISNGLKISDIYYRNFGILNNQLYFFDYHNIDSFAHTSHGFLIKNLYCLFTRLGINYNPNGKWQNCLDIKDIKSSQLILPNENFGKNRFPRCFYRLLISLNEQKSTESINYLKQCQDYLANLIASQYAFVNVCGEQIKKDEITNITANAMTDAFAYLYDCVCACACDNIISIVVNIPDNILLKWGIYVWLSIVKSNPHIFFVTVNKKFMRKSELLFINNLAINQDSSQIQSNTTIVIKTTTNNVFTYCYTDSGILSEKTVKTNIYMHYLNADKYLMISSLK